MCANIIEQNISSCQRHFGVWWKTSEKNTKTFQWFVETKKTNLMRYQIQAYFRKFLMERTNKQVKTEKPSLARNRKIFQNKL